MQAGRRFNPERILRCPSKTLQLNKDAGSSVGEGMIPSEGGMRENRTSGLMSGGRGNAGHDRD